MNIGLIAVDSKYPNLALMKISAYHKQRGDNVEWYSIFANYDIVYLAKIFTFTEDYKYAIPNAARIEKGGTGYDIVKKLPADIDRLQPDYTIYNIDNLAYGFLTRGCPNKCKWCIVPQKEGTITPYMDIEEIAQDRKNVILMDNNILASDYGLNQIEKIIKLGLRVDFNQALDARLVTDEIAKMLAKVKWLKPIRFGCDTNAQIKHVEKAAHLIDKYGYKGSYTLYCILIELHESFNRVEYWREKRRFDPFAQPYRDWGKNFQIIPKWQKDLAHWCNRKWLYRSCSFLDYEPRKGFKCKNYFNIAK